MIQYSELLDLAPSPADRRERYGAGPLHFGELRHARNANGKRPLVVFIHGGCWQSEYDLTHVAAAAAAIADAGFNVWTPEYRRLGDAGGGWTGTFDDVADAVDHVTPLAALNPGIDGTRVILAGHSAGGQLALWAASRRADGPDPKLGTRNDPRRVHAVVGLAAITNLAAYGTAAGSCNSSVRVLLGGTAAEQPDRYRTVSPAERLPLGVPVHLVHGSADPIVPVASAEEFAEKARAAGDRVELSIVPGAGHFDVIAPSSVAWPYVIDAIRAAAK